jgi:uncharacterized membrane protein YfcA
MPFANQNPLLVAFAIALLGFLVGFAKGGFATVGALHVTVLSLIMPVTQAVGVQLAILMVGDLFALYFYWKQWDTAILKRTLPAAIVGAWVGTYLLTILSTNVLRLVLGLFVLVIVVYKLVSDRLKKVAYESRPWHGPAAGALAGLSSGMFNNGGPPFNAYMLFQGATPRTFAATAALFFAILNLVKIPGFLYTGVLDVNLLLSIWWSVLFIPLGVWVARWVITNLDAKFFEWVIIVLLVISSAILIWQGL